MDIIAAVGGGAVQLATAVAALVSAPAGGATPSLLLLGAGLVLVHRRRTSAWGWVVGWVVGWLVALAALSLA